jgi:hypothetical protein
MERTGWENFGVLLLFVQFPFYATIVTILNGTRMKIASVVLIIVLHVIASVFGYRNFCQSRRTCAISTPSIHSVL